MNLNKYIFDDDIQSVVNHVLHIDFDKYLIDIYPFMAIVQVRFGGSGHGWGLFENSTDSLSKMYQCIWVWGPAKKSYLIINTKTPATLDVQKQ